MNVAEFIFRTLYISHKDQAYNVFKIVLTVLYACITEIDGGNNLLQRDCS